MVSIKDKIIEFFNLEDDYLKSIRVRSQSSNNSIQSFKNSSSR